MIAHTLHTPENIESGSEAEKDFWWQHTGENIQSFLTEAPDKNSEFLQKVQHAFDATDEQSVSCVDGRTPNGALHLAGSGILIAEEQGEEAALATLRAMKLSTIYSHENCGAAALVAKLRGKDPHDGDTLGKEWALHAAQTLGIRYGGHLPVEPKRLHPERAIFIDGTGRFNISATDSYVPGFFVSYRYHQVPNNALREIGLGITIAFSSRGFEHRFSPNAPFLLFIVGHPTELQFDAQTIRKEVEHLLDTDDTAKMYRDRIALRTFTPPAEWIR